jgi:transposase InsO family protein
MPLPRPRRARISSNRRRANACSRANLGVTVDTVRRWRKRTEVQDASHTPHRLQTTLTPMQEAVAVEIRRTLLLPLDDLLGVVRELLNPSVSRSGLDRCLRRHGVAHLRDLIPEAEGERAAKKTFKDYVPGFIHIDIKYLPQMPDEKARRYLFVAIDRATRWVYLRLYTDQSEVSSTDFLRHLRATAPMKIVKVLTDNRGSPPGDGSQFTDRFTGKRKTPSAEHAFDRECMLLGIEHRLIPSRHPQTHGMVERFNGRISDVLATTRFVSGEQLATTIKRYAVLYNQHIPQKALGHRTPLDTLRDWQTKQPELFVRNVRKLPGSRLATLPQQIRQRVDAVGHAVQRFGGGRGDAAGVVAGGGVELRGECAFLLARTSTISQVSKAHGARGPCWNAMLPK